LKGAKKLRVNPKSLRVYPKFLKIFFLLKIFCVPLLSMLSEVFAQHAENPGAK